MLWKSALVLLPVMAGFFDTPSPSGEPLISDILGIDKSITILTEYSLGLAEIAERLQDSSKYTIVLAPSNTAIMAMERKPWQDADPASKAPLLTAEDKDTRASDNIARFIKSHIVALDSASWKADVKKHNLLGQPLWYATNDNQRSIQPENIEVRNIRKAKNGEIWTINHILQIKASEDQRRPDL